MIMTTTQVSLTTEELTALEELLSRTLIDRVGPDGEIGEGDDEAEHLLGIYNKVDALISPPDWDGDDTVDMGMFVPPHKWPEGITTEIIQPGLYVKADASVGNHPY
jgi:hypothetical protein